MMTTNTELAEAIRDLEALEARYHAELDPARQTLLIEEIGDIKALIEHLTYADSRGGDDLINDGVFHAGGR